MPLSITALGTGAADARRYAKTSFFINDGTTNMLIDAGGGDGILGQLAKTEINISDIQAVFITHLHIDHFLGLFWLLRFRGAAICNDEASAITVYAAPRVIQAIREMSLFLLKQKILDRMNVDIVLHAVEDATELSLGSWSVGFFDTLSKKETQYGCRITFPDNRKIAFIGDEPYRESMRSWCVGSDCLFHDAYCLEEDRHLFHPEKMHHSTVEEAAMHARELKVKNLILFHTEDKKTFGDRKLKYARAAESVYSGTVIVPDDGERILF